MSAPHSVRHPDVARPRTFEEEKAARVEAERARWPKAADVPNAIRLIAALIVDKPAPIKRVAS